MTGFMSLIVSLAVVPVVTGPASLIASVAVVSVVTGPVSLIASVAVVPCSYITQFFRIDLLSNKKQILNKKKLYEN